MSIVAVSEILIVQDNTALAVAHQPAAPTTAVPTNDKRSGAAGSGSGRSGAFIAGPERVRRAADQPSHGSLHRSAVAGPDLVVLLLALVLVMLVVVVVVVQVTAHYYLLIPLYCCRY